MRFWLTIATLATPALVGAQVNAAPTGQYSTLVAGVVGNRADSVLRVAERNGFSGVVRLARGDTIALRKGYGTANRTAETPFTPATIVQIGSNTKDFTAVAILQLQDAGRLNVADSIGRFFSGVPADKRGITIRQLLEHRAGLPDFVGSGGDFEPVSRAEFLSRLWGAPLRSPPGSAESYSNAGYSLLAAIIEVRSGVSYDQYVQEHICVPLGLQNTGFVLPHFDAAALAHGYRRGADIGTILGHPHPSDGPYWNLRGNGGMSSTLEEMHIFYEALFASDKLLRPETRRIRFDPSGPVALAGSDGVSYFLYERFPRLGVELIVASNNSEYPAVRVRRELAGALGLPGGEQTAAAGTRSAGSGRPARAAVAELVSGFVTAINSADQATIRAFIGQHFTAETSGPTADQRAERLTQLAKNQGRVTVVAVTETSTGNYDVAARNTAGEALTLRMAIDETPPPRIRTLGVIVGG